MTAPPSPAQASDASDLPYGVADALLALDFEIPAYRKLSNGEVGGLGMEALEGYAYGARTRFDTLGRRWDFRREVINDVFWLTVRCTVGGILLCEGAMPLDRVASREGEDELLEMVGRLTGDATEVGGRYRHAQQGLRTDSERAARDAQDALPKPEKPPADQPPGAVAVSQAAVEGKDERMSERPEDYRDQYGVLKTEETQKLKEEAREKHMAAARAAAGDHRRQKTERDKADPKPTADNPRGPNPPKDDPQPGGEVREQPVPDPKSGQEAFDAPENRAHYQAGGYEAEKDDGKSAPKKG